MARLKKYDPIKKTFRLYPGRDPDDTIIEWLSGFADSAHGVEGAELKTALFRGITGGSNGAEAAAGAVVDVDLGQIRQVVEAGVSAVMARFTGSVDVAETATEDDEAEGLLDRLGGSLVLEGED